MTPSGPWRRPTSSPNRSATRSKTPRSSSGRSTTGSATRPTASIRSSASSPRTRKTSGPTTPTPSARWPNSATASRRSRTATSAPPSKPLTRATKQLDQPAGERPNEAKSPQTQSRQQDQANQSTAKPDGANAQAGSETKPKDAQKSGEQPKPTGGETKPTGDSNAQPRRSTKPTGAEKSGDQPKPSTGDTKPSHRRIEAKRRLATGWRNEAKGRRLPKRASARSTGAGRGRRRTSRRSPTSWSKMLAGLSQFDTVRTAAKEAKGLLDQQEEAIKQAARKPPRQADMVGKNPDALTPEQKAALGNLAAKQAEIAKGLQNLESKMDEMARASSTPTTPSAPRAFARPPRRAAKRPPPPRWGRPPTSSTRTRWARLRPARSRPSAT